LWVLESSWDHERVGGRHHEQDELNCGILASGQYFCENAALSFGSPSTVTIATATPVEVYKFSGELLQKLRIKYDKNSVMVLNQSLSLFNPKADKLKYFYQNKFIWEAKRQKIIEDISARAPSRLPPVFDRKR
jgi:hypothetical protein